MTDYREQSDHDTMIFKLLGTGEENAISCKALAQYYDTDRRNIVKLVHEERENGKPICMSNNGYFKPKNEHEISATLQSFIKRNISTLKIIKVFKAALSEFNRTYEQMTLDEFMNKDA